MGLCGSSSFDADIRRQEAWVNKEFQAMGDGWKSKRMAAGGKYNSGQIKGKLRQEYHGRASNSNSYVNAHTWSTMR